MSWAYRWTGIGLVAVLMSGCATEGSSTADASAEGEADGSRAGGGDASAGGAADGGGQPDADGGDDSESTAYCYARCEVASDCVLEGAAAPYDEDNYACDDGLCVWTGCNDTAECAEVDEDHVCARRDEAATPQCHPSCQAPGDCALGSSVYDEDNYSCDEGACVWLGCNTDAECQDVFGEDYVCADAALSFPTCALSCAQPADCVREDANPLFNEDNYSCDEGACVWLGCNDAAECEADSGDRDMACAPAREAPARQPTNL